MAERGPLTLGWSRDKKIKGMNSEERIDYAIESRNKWGRDLSNYFLKLVDILERYPTARFWFYVGFT